MLAQSVNHVTLDTSPSPTKSERDSVGFWKGWCGARDGGAAIPPVVARILSGDSISPLTRGGKNVVRSEGGLAIPPVVARIFSGDSTSPLTREASVMV